MDSRTEQESAGGSGGWLPGPHEAGMHGVYVGLLHLLQGEPDAARVAFQRGVEADGVVPGAKAQGSGEEAPQRADNALLFWLAGRMAHLMGMTDRAFVDFGRAAEARRFAVDHQASGAREPRVLRDPIAGNLVCVVELGIAPEKTVGGPDGGLAVFLPRPQRAVSVAIELDGELIGEPEVLMDVGYQGATRGGAPIAGIRGREVVMADDPAARAQRPTVTGAGPLLIAAMTGEPVDTRHWSTLPATVAVLAAEVPPGQHALALRFADRFGVPLPELDQVHLIAIGEGQEAWFMFRDLPPDPAQLFPEFDF